MLKGIKHHVYKVMEYNIGMKFYMPSWDKPEVVELTLEAVRISFYSNDYADIVLDLSQESGAGERYKLEDVGYHIFTSEEDANRKAAEMYGIRIEEEQ